MPKFTQSLGIFWATPLEALPVTPIHANTPASPHVTLAWGVRRDKYQIEGLITSIYFQEECWSDRIQAIRCTLQSGIPFELQVPHCTISWIDGVRPVESTNMLIYAHEAKPLDLLIPCQIEWVELEDAIGLYRKQILGLMTEGRSLNQACKILEIPPSTAQGWFKTLPEDDFFRQQYEAYAARNKGGWQLGRSRKAKD